MKKISLQVLNIHKVTLLLVIFLYCEGNAVYPWSLLKFVADE